MNQPEWKAQATGLLGEFFMHAPLSSEDIVATAAVAVQRDDLHTTFASQTGDAGHRQRVRIPLGARKMARSIRQQNDHTLPIRRTPRRVDDRRVQAVEHGFGPVN